MQQAFLSSCRALATPVLRRAERNAWRHWRAALAVLVLSLSFISPGAFAQSIWTNPITDSNPSAANPFTAGQTVAPNLTVSGIGRGPGLNGNSGSNRYNALPWSATLDANDYFYFTLTPSPGYKLNLTSFSYTAQASGTGPTQAAFRSSLDGYGANIGTANTSNATISLSAANYQDLTGAITFRFYAWAGSNPTTGTFSINDFTFNGAVVQLPAITASTTTLSAFSTMQGTSSTEETFTVSGTALSTPLVVTAPDGYELRENNVGSFGSTVSFNGPAVSTRTIEVRMTGAAAGNFSGNITCTSTGATTRNIAVSGEVTDLATVVDLTPASGTFAENAGSFNLTVSILNPSPSAATTVDLVLTGDAARVGGFTTQTLTFPAGSSAAHIVPITITDNGYWDRGAEVLFTLENISGGINAAAANDASLITITETLTYGLVINELDYAMAGSPDKFIELKNTGSSAIDLAGFSLLFLYDDGTGATAYDSLFLPTTILAAGDYFVIAGAQGTVANTDLGGQVVIDNLFGEAGLALAIGLRAPSLALIDALSYEGDVPGYGTGGASALLDPSSVDGVSLARIPDGQDTNTAADWRAACPTPGTPNSAPGSTCDDGDPATVLDMVQADCSCAGSTAPTVDCEGVEGGTAMPGTACNDLDPETLNDLWTLDCACVGTPLVRDCLGVIDGPALPGTACDDGNIYTVDDAWTAACSCTGTLVPTPPAVTTSTADAVASVGATLHATVSDAGSSAISAYGFEYATTAGFAPGTGTLVNASDLAAGSFSAALIGLLPSTTYHFMAFATNDEGTTYGNALSFTTTGLDAPVASAATDMDVDRFTAHWLPVEGATGYRLDVSTSPTFGTVNLTNDLFFSEYVEGSSNNKYLEIFNGTGATVDLSDYRLSIYSNGGTTPNPTFNQEVVLSGQLAHGEVVVYKHPSATLYSGAATSFPSNGPINFNGNDALGLFRLSTGNYVDVFGRIGEDPGSAWTGGGLSTLDRTLVRKSTVLGGVTANPASGFPTLATEWNGLAIDNVTGLGSHGFVSYVPSFVPGYQDLAVTGLSQEVTGLANGVTYYYRVRAIGGASTSANSNVIEVTTGANDCLGVFNGPAVPGTACDDGDASTIQDVYGTDCVCLGEPAPLVDCNGVENGPDMPGTGCDDNNEYTINDTWTNDCLCLGTFVPTVPTVTTVVADAITATDAVLHGSIEVDGSSAITTYGFQWSNTLFTPGSGTAMASSDLSAGAFSATLAGLAPGTTVQYVAFASNTEGTAYGTVLSFTTAPLAIPVATEASAVESTTFTANWDSVAFATGYLLDVSTSPTFTGPVPATDLFLSEYVEGASNNKYLEVFNGTGAAVDLSDYQLVLYANGAVVPTNNVTLSGTLANGAVVVYKNSGATVYTGDAINSAAANYNGDDAVALRRISTNSYVDVFGSIGHDPGTAWTADGLSTLDRTLVRKPAVSTGLTENPATTFPTLATEWIGLPINDVSDLGQHTYSGQGPSFLTGFHGLPVSGTSYEVAGLEPGVTYYYRVRAVLDTHVSDNSNTIAVTTTGGAGCTDPVAQDHDANATTDDGSCTYCPATITYNTAIPTPIGIGTGLPAANAAVSVDCHPITIGLAAFERYVGAIVPVSDNVYRVALGNSPVSGSDNTPAVGLARWNYLLSVDLGTFDFTQVQVLLDVDFDPAVEPVWNTLDLSAQLAAQEQAGLHVFQAAENPGFPFWQTLFPGVTFDPHIVGRYDLRVRALSMATGTPIAELPIVVEVFCPDSDNDGVSDCEDECPEDPAKVLAGACGCGVEDVATAWYADVDGDGFGDLNAPLAGFTCVQPEGYVANSTDDCPAVPGVIGSVCDDGDATTGNDTIGADCVCAGLPIDCLGTIGGNALPGTPCDDDDATTENDVYGADCLCAGTPVVPVCTGHEITLTIHTGVAGGQVTWTVVDLSGAELIGGGPYTADGSTIEETICLPFDLSSVGGLRLFNNAGAGLGAGGAWEVRDAAGALVLRDVFATGAVSPAAVTASPGYGNYHSLELPLGAASIAEVSCGKLALLRQDRVFADAVPGASNYQFQFADPDAGFRRRIAVPRNWVRIAEMVTLPLQAGTVYFTAVRVDQGVAGFADDRFGAGCELGLTAATNCTGLIDNPGANSHSCGVTRAFGGSAKIWANPVSGASTYRFRFSHPATGFVRTIDRATYVCALNWVTLPLLDGLTYDVDVQVFAYGAWVGYCGPVCPVTIGTTPVAPALAGNDELFGEPSLRLWPNPHAGGPLYVAVEGLQSINGLLPLEVFDAQGRSVLTTNIALLEGPAGTPIDIGGLAAGTYLVRISHAEGTLTQRLVMGR